MDFPDRELDRSTHHGERFPAISDPNSRMLFRRMDTASQSSDRQECGQQSDQPSLAGDLFLNTIHCLPMGVRACVAEIGTPRQSVASWGSPHPRPRKQQYQLRRPDAWPGRGLHPGSTRYGRRSCAIDCMNPNLLRAIDCTDDLLALCSNIANRLRATTIESYREWN
jgi:hypothetical protein